MKLSEKLLPAICAFALLSAATSQAAMYQVTVDTAALEGNANAPFYVDFQMNYGGTGSGNSASINNFNFGTGGSPSPSGSAIVYLGTTAGGDLSTGLTLADNSSSPFNEIAQEFTPGSSLTFDVNLSANAPTGQTPDDLIFSIDDASTYPIGTTAPDQLSLVYFQINTYGHSPAISVDTYTFASGDAGDDITGVTASVVPVPEPATYGAIGGACLLLVCIGSQLRRKTA